MFLVKKHEFGFGRYAVGVDHEDHVVAARCGAMDLRPTTSLPVGSRHLEGGSGTVEIRLNYPLARVGLMGDRHGPHEDDLPDVGRLGRLQIKDLSTVDDVWNVRDGRPVSWRSVRLEQVRRAEDLDHIRAAAVV